MVDRLIASGSEHFCQHIWKEAPLPERLILSAAAEELTLKQLDVVGMETIFDRVLSLAPDISRKELMEALERLTAKEILHEKNLRIHFPVNLFRKWLHHRHPLVKVRAEI